MSSRLLLIQSHLKYDSSVLIKRHLFFYQSKQLTCKTWILVCHQWRRLKSNFLRKHCRANSERILLSSTVKLSEIIRSEANERFLNAFNNAIAFIFDIDDYTASICVCVEVLSSLRYKINNTRPTLNEIMLIIAELKNVHERDEDRVCLKHWKKMIFLTSAILKSLLLFSFNKIIVS